MPRVLDDTSFEARLDGEGSSHTLKMLSECGGLPTGLISTLPTRISESGAGSKPLGCGAEVFAISTSCSAFARAWYARSQMPDARLRFLSLLVLFKVIHPIGPVRFRGNPPK